MRARGCFALSFPPLGSIVSTVGTGAGTGAGAGAGACAAAGSAARSPLLQVPSLLRTGDGGNNKGASGRLRTGHDSAAAIAAPEMAVAVRSRAIAVAAAAAAKEAAAAATAAAVAEALVLHSEEALRALLGLSVIAPRSDASAVAVRAAEATSVITLAHRLRRCVRLVVPRSPKPCSSSAASLARAPAPQTGPRSLSAWWRPSGELSARKQRSASTLLITPTLCPCPRRWCTRPSISTRSRAACAPFAARTTRPRCL